MNRESTTQDRAASSFDDLAIEIVLRRARANVEGLLPLRRGREEALEWQTYYGLTLAQRDSAAKLAVKRGLARLFLNDWEITLELIQEGTRAPSCAEHLQESA